MGHSEQSIDEVTRGRLVETARAMVLRGDGKFSISSLCREAGVERVQFRDHFSGKAALMAAVMQTHPVREAAPIEIAPPAAPEAAQAPIFSQRLEIPAPEPVSEPTPKAEQTFESSVSTPDAWLERRLRVFERALNALEAKAEASAREQARMIAQLEEKLNGAPAHVALPELVTMPAAAAVQPAEKPKVEPAPAKPQDHLAELASVKQDEAPAAEEMQAKAAPAIAPMPIALTSKEDMADLLQSARDKVRAAAAEPQEPAAKKPGLPRRWLTFGALSLAALFLVAALSLGKTMLGGSAHALESDGVSYRHAASTTLAKTTALADAGDPRAQARLALAYLRGQGSAGDANAALLWSLSAARSGNPVAQYILGALYQQGDHVKADPAIAFAWFSRAAEKGNLKAMHNLAIAYAQGLGTPVDQAKAAEWFTRAAERGYVDSAFDLAVLYERGTGVKQDLKQSLKWYRIAALAGDAPSKTRAEFLRSQMKAGDAKLADNAAMAFSPLPALGEANSL